MKNTNEKRAKLLETLLTNPTELLKYFYALEYRRCGYLLQGTLTREVLDYLEEMNLDFKISRGYLTCKWQIEKFIIDITLTLDK